MTKPSKSKPEIEKPLWIGAHFGFEPIEPPRITPKDIEAVRDCDDAKETSKSGRPLFDPAEKAAYLRTYLERNYSSLPHPVAVSYRKHTENKKWKDYSFEFAGFSSGTAEALLIRTALSVLLEEGHKSLCVDLNSIGDKDSISAYERELQQYARRIAGELDADLKKRIKKNVFHLLSVVAESERASESVKEKLPASIASLSPQSRAQFKEVLEHIEMLGAEFRLLPTLVGNRYFCSDTLFAIRDMDEDEIYAVGYRYSRLGKKFGFKKEIPLAGVTVFTNEKAPKKTYKELPKPRFYLVQLGRDAKMKSLPLIELLRRERIAIHHSLAHDKIGSQLGSAERLRVPYIMILGQKEALEDSVTIRNVSTRAQDTIPLKDLPLYLKNLPF